MSNSGIYLNLMVAMVTKNGWQNRLKIEKSPFWTKYKGFGDQFFKNKISAQLNTKIIYVVCLDNSLNMLKYLFGICLCSVLISLSNVSNLFQNSQFPVLGLFFGCHYHSNGKS